MSRRGPRKGDGGRPKSRLIIDSDREVIAIAMLLTKSSEEPRAAALKIADMLLCDRPDTVDMELHDVENSAAGVSLTNSAGDDPNSEEIWRRRPLDPSREREWRTRLETLRRKLSTEYNSEDLIWFGQSALALEMLLAPAERERAFVLLRCLGWRLSPIIEARLSKWLDRLIP